MDFLRKFGFFFLLLGVLSDFFDSVRIRIVLS